MNIHEYQAKQILKSFGVAVQEGIVAETADEAYTAALKLKEQYGSDWLVGLYSSLVGKLYFQLD